MTKNDVLSAVMALEGATMCRQNKSNFVAIPVEDGFVKVNVATALAEVSGNHQPFNFEAAKAEYKAWETAAALRAAERANKPAQVKGPNPEAQARRDEMDAKIANLPAFTDYTATDIMNALAGQLADNVTVMAIGSSAGRLVEKGILTVDIRKDEKNPKGKKYYTKG